MSDQNLRKAVIRLAHAKPELRSELLPLLKSSSSHVWVQTDPHKKILSYSSSGKEQVEFTYSTRGDPDRWEQDVSGRPINSIIYGLGERLNQIRNTPWVALQELGYQRRSGELTFSFTIENEKDISKTNHVLDNILHKLQREDDDLRYVFYGVMPGDDGSFGGDFTLKQVDLL